MFQNMVATHDRTSEEEKRDINAGMWGNITDQLEQVCRALTSDPKLADGFNAVGFSQGGLFLRALVERCSGLNVRNLVTFGSPHAGVSKAPLCDEAPGIKNVMCKFMRTTLIPSLVYLGVVQKRLVQAQYFKDVNNIQRYLQTSFLPVINNEVAVNPVYAYNLNRLHNLVLVKFSRDSMIIPGESAWFGSLTANGTVVSMQEQELYTYLGLDVMMESGRLHLKTIHGPHLAISPAMWRAYFERCLK